MSEISDSYPYIVKDVMTYILSIKEKDKHAALLDIISDYCFKKGIDSELVGDAISTDEYFKSFIAKDCEYHNIIKSNINKDAEW